MSRFSPTIAPVYANPFASALDAGFDAFLSERDRKRQQKAADAITAQRTLASDDAHTASLANLYAMGYRQPSEIPEAPAAFTPVSGFTPTSSAMLGRQLRAGPSAAAPIEPTTPSGDDLAAALRGNLSPGTASAVDAALRTSPTAAPAMAPTQAGAPVKPGLWSAAFDASTGTFGGAPPPAAGVMIAKAVQQRLSNGMVLDPNQTPDAIRQRETIAQEQRRTDTQRAVEVDQQGRDYRTLAAIEPDHAAVKDRPFDPTGHLNYSVLLADALKRQQERNTASLRVTEHGPATLHATTVNPLTRKVEDVYSDGTRKVIRDATAEEVRKATYIAPEHEKYGTFVDPKDPTKPPVFIHEDAAAALGLVPFQKPSASATAGPKPLAAPIAAKVGQFGEMLKKADQLLPIVDALDVGLGNSAARDIAEHGIGLGSMRIPGTKGLGNRLMNVTPTYSQYQAALSPFILAAAHALSGARINQDQVEQIRKSIEMAPGDFANKVVREQKIQNIIDLINSIGGSLPAEGVTAQENQMDEEALGRMAGRGYKRIGSAGSRAAPKSGDITLPGADDAATRAAAWKTANPRKPGESDDAYFRRFKASQGTP